MQINVRPIGTLPYTTIADSGVGDLIDFRAPSLGREDFTTTGYGAAGKTVIDMGNSLWTLIVPIRKFYTSDILARQAFATIGMQISIGNLDLQILDVTVLDATYMPNCTVASLDPDSGDGQRGTAINFTLKFTGPNYTTVAP